MSVRSFLIIVGMLSCAMHVLAQTPPATGTPVPPVAPATTAPKPPPLRHPLDPLTEDEYKAIFKLLKEQKRTTRATVFSYVGLKEPEKSKVLEHKPGDLVVRRAFLILYESKSNQTIEAVVNVTENKVESWEPKPGIQAPGFGPDERFVDRLVRMDNRWQAAVRKRGLDPVEVGIGGAPARGYVDRPDGSRYILAMSFWDDPEGGAEVQGLLALVNLTKRTVEWVRDEAQPSPRSNPDDDFDPDSITKHREPPKALKITQPDGPSFILEGNEVRWQKWRFRLGHDPRSGLVLHTVGYEDEGKLRSVLYRGSLSELYVPYGDPSWVLMHWFDAGEFGLGQYSHSPLQPMGDVPEHAKLLPAQTHSGDGKPRTVPNAVAIYEKDAGILWRHGGTSRRARQLVVGSIYQVGNYDYGVNWIFHQDGVLEVQVELTGLMITRQVERKSDSENGNHNGSSGSVGTLVAPNMQAPNHQHFFSFRLDVDVDGPVKNALYEMNVESLEAGNGNKQGNGFSMRETLLKTEKQAMRNNNPATARSWRVVNPAVRNGLGQASSYMLMPSGSAVPYALPKSYLSTVGAFANHHLWATPYREGEHFAAGTYVRDGTPTDGLAKWTVADRLLEFEDVVLWYTVGVTHIPRPEEWPIMTVHQAGFKLMPFGFFTKNPALDVPEYKPPKPPGSG